MPETSLSHPKIYFEPGNHPAKQSDQDSVYKKTISGEVNVHMWNSEISERLSTYSPDIIAVDSMDPTGVDDDGKMDFDYKASIWTLMPGTPQQINGQNEILVIAGDNTYAEPGNNGFIEDNIRFMSSAGIFLGSISVASRIAGRITQDRPNEEPQTFYDYEAEDRKLKSSVDRILSRRKFLATLLAGGLSVFVLESDNLATFLPWQVPENTLIDINTDVQSVLPDRIIDIDNLYEYIEGRTALLIAKTQDSIRAISGLRSNVGAVVMGSAHSFQANDLIADPELRDEHIRRHAELMLQLARRSNATFNGRWTPAGRERWVIDNEIDMLLLKVLEPDPERFRAEPRREIDRIIQFERKLPSPSVSTAVNGLRRLINIE